MSRWTRGFPLLLAVAKHPFGAVFDFNGNRQRVAEVFDGSYQLMESCIRQELAAKVDTQ